MTNPLLNLTNASDPLREVCAGGSHTITSVVSPGHMPSAPHLVYFGTLPKGNAG